MLNWQFEVKKVSTNNCFRLHIYLRTNKSLIRDYLHVFVNWGKYFSHKKCSTFTVHECGSL